MKINEIQIFGRPCGFWLLMLAAVAFVGLLIWIGLAISGDVSLKAMLATPILKLTLGHCQAMVFIAWLLFR